MKNENNNLTQMDHSKMDHSKMDHSKMDHSKMDHSKMDHGTINSAPQMNHHDHSSNNSYTYEGQILFLILLIYAIINFIKFKPNSIPKTSNQKRFDIFNFPLFESIVKWKYFSFTLRLIPSMLFVMVIVTGLAGNLRSTFAANITWLFWWTILIFLVAIGGKIFCAACPWDFFANLFSFGLKQSNKKVNLGLKWPRKLSNIYLATFFFILLTWLELGFEITTSSYITAILGLVVVATVIISSLIFEKKAFCRYACPVGRISGLYSQFSPIELRVKEKEPCKTCTTFSCVKGTEHSTACPTSLAPYRIRENTYCTLCTECIRSCEKNNLTLKIRPLAIDLKKVKSKRNDESTLAIILAILTFFHGLTMTSHWFKMTGFLSNKYQLTYIQSFSILMTALLLGSLLLYVGLEKLINKIMISKDFTGILTFSLIPIVLGYHLGHNGMHLFGEITYILPSINDPFGNGWNLLNLKGYVPTPLVEHSDLKYFQLLCITIGFYFTMSVLRSRVLQITKKAIDRSKIFAICTLVMLSITGLAIWFVYQPMMMRSIG